MSSDTNGPLCQCGCGEGLPIGSKRKFKRGHAVTFQKERVKEIIAENNNPAPPPLPADDAFSELGHTWDDIPDPFEVAAASIPDDPSPDEEARKATDIRFPPIEGQIIVTKEVAKDIQGKVAFMLAMPAAMLMPLDPVCLPVLQQQVPEISAKLVPIICQSPDMVRFFSKGTGFFLWLNLASAVWPVIQVVIAHHITKSIEVKEGKVKEKDFSKYAA